jgi:hypothetical protein
VSADHRVSKEYRGRKENKDPRVFREYRGPREKLDLVEKTAPMAKMVLMVIPPFVAPIIGLPQTRQK